jgi:hypothetical protein
MQVIRSICQYDYPATLTSTGKPANQTGCVLACLQMQIETITGERYLETEFYNKLLANRIIRDDCYINNYDDALRLMLIDRAEFRGQVQVVEAIKRFSMRWGWFHAVNIPKNSHEGEFIPPIPLIAFMKKRKHAVLIKRFSYSQDGEVFCAVIDPQFRAEEAQKVMYLSDFKKFGVFQ